MNVPRKNVVRVLMCFLMTAVLLIGGGCAGPFGSPQRDKAPSPENGSMQEPTITLYNKEKGKVEKIAMEKYVQGVVAGEMETDWPTEALAAQAILARTFTLKKIEQGGVEKYNTDASTDVEEFQAYAPEKINDKVKQAVNETRGVVATYDNKYINGWFHADAGGRTAASAVEGLEYRKEKAPYVHSVPDPGFKISPPENKSWKAEFSLTQARQKIQNFVGRDPGAVTQAKVLKKGPSGRAEKIRVGQATLSGPALRLALGSQVMRSTLLERLEVSEGKLVVEGRGYGHGVGMSQWGAKALAEQGRSAEEIVKYFFKDIEIKKIWN